MQPTVSKEINETDQYIVIDIKVYRQIYIYIYFYISVTDLEKARGWLACKGRECFIYGYMASNIW